MTNTRYILRANTSELLDVRLFQSYPLNSIAVEILGELLQFRTPSEAAWKISTKYGASKDSVLADIQDLLAQLSQLGIEIANIASQSNSTISRHPFSGITTPILHIIQNCNSPCVMCDCWRTKGVVKLELQQLKPIIREFAGQGASAIMVSGGEPLLHHALADIIIYIKSLGMKVELNTNGYLLNRRTELAALEIETLVISVDGIDSETYKLIRGKDWLDQISDNIQTFKAGSPITSIGVRATLNKHLFSRLEEFFFLMETWKCDSVGFSPLDLTSDSFARAMDAKRTSCLAKSLLPLERELRALLGPVGDNDRVALNKMHALGKSTWSGEDYDRCLEHYLSILNENGAEFSSTDDAPCFFPFTSSLVDYDGNIKICFYSQSIGSIYDLATVD